MTDSYLYGILLLLPLAACMLVFQANPYHALVLRGILGAVAALVYAVLGAADVALTEALVGTMLAITLYAVAVRSSLVMRLGLLKDEAIALAANPDLSQLIQELRQTLGKHHLRLELVPYPDLPALNQALQTQEVHATCVPRSQLPPENPDPGLNPQPYQTATRVQRLYEIFQAELGSPVTHLIYTSATEAGEEH